MVTVDRAESAWRRWLPRAWSLALALLLLGPALGRGYVLSYDMVWVPDLALRGDFLGLASGLPRAVPSDAVVSVLDGLVPGAVLQKLVLLGCLVPGGIGAARLAPGDSLVGRLVAVSVYQWNPFVVERLLIGHWPVLLGYAVLPWVVVGARRWRTEASMPGALCLLVPLGSLSASAGVATAVVLLAFALARHRTRSNVTVLALVVAANAPWLVSGLLHASAASTDAAGADAFALNRDGALPGPVAALGLGGIWNTEVDLPSRDGVLAWLSLAFLLVLAIAGARAWIRRTGRRDAVAFGACWAVGYLLAVLTWLAPDLMGWLVVQVPGAGLFRDGARALVLCAPLLVSVVAQGAAEVWRRAPRAAVARTSLAAAIVVLPITLLPDAALGLSGRLRPATFPSAYQQAREVVSDQQRRDGDEAGDLLVLPLTSYRQPGWNHDHKVLDPMGRFLTPDYVASDRLVVSGVDLAGEDPRLVEVSRALAGSTPEARSRSLADLGIGVVVVEHDAPGDSPEVAGETLLDTTQLTVIRVAEPVPRTVPGGWIAGMTLAWVLYLAALLVGVVRISRAGLTARRRAGAKAMSG
ncbi:MAG: hypothetical protein JWO11_857 [Nocardioides sp.]|nr:hypothetical protein [Nocardioides sp.]